MNNPVNSEETDIGHLKLKHQTINAKRLRNRKMKSSLYRRKDLIKNTDSYGDLTGAFPEVSYEGYKYILVIVHYLGLSQFVLSKVDQAKTYQMLMKVFLKYGKLKANYH